MLISVDLSCCVFADKQPSNPTVIGMPSESADFYYTFLQGARTGQKSDARLVFEFFSSLVNCIIFVLFQFTHVPFLADRAG